MFKSLVIKLFILLIAFGGLAFWFSTQKPLVSKVLTLSKRNTELAGPKITNISGEPSPRDSTPSDTAPTVTETLALNTDNDLALPALLEASEVVGLKSAFSLKYNKTLENVSVFIENQSGNYASGSVDFDNSGYPATFYAYTNGETWTIVAVENGVVSCSSINGYSFPSSMVPQCYDVSSGAVVYR